MPKREITAVEIIATVNGYVVREGGWRMQDKGAIDDCHVFETFDNVVAYLRGNMPIHGPAQPV